MKKLIITAFVIFTNVVAFAGGPEEAIQDAEFICDHMGGNKKAQVASPSRGETPDFYLDYNRGNNTTQNNIGSQNNYEGRGGYNNTYGGYSRTGERHDTSNTTTNTTSGSIPFKCVDVDK